MSDAGEFFDQLEEADAVTTDGADSVQSAIKQSEVDRARPRRETNSSPSSRRPRRSLTPEYVARCRFCRCKFTAASLARYHEGRCDAEPVSQCRYCEAEHTPDDDPERHLDACEAYQSILQQEHDQGETDDTVEEAEDESFARLFIDPQPHEFHAYLKWDCSSLENPLRSYFGLRSLQGEHNFEDHGRLRTSMELGDDTWAVEFGFKPSGIAPRDRPDFQLDEVREYLIYVYPDAYSSWADAKDEARQRAYFRISPRWPDMSSKDGLKSMSNPDIEGYDVEMEGSYWEFKQYPEVFQRALDTLADRQGFRFNSPTYIHPEDFNPRTIHSSSNIVDGEYYVRVKIGETDVVIAYDGTLHRISLLLSGDRQGYAKTVRDDRECPGYYHTATIDARRASELIGSHELPKEFKHYHMRNPDAVKGTKLEHPKIGVSFQNSIHDGTLYWDDLDKLETELDEALLNVLEWSDIPTRPDDHYFVEDDYFTVTGSRRWRKLLPERLPRIESKQDDQIFATASQMNATDAELVDTLLTDGGTTSPADLADSIGVHLDTVYRALKRLRPLVDHTYGEVQLGSKYIAQELTGYIDQVSESIQRGWENALDGLTRAESFGDDADPWSRWLDQYGGTITATEGADPDELEVGFQPESIEDARELLRQGARRWAEVTGNPLRQFGFEFAPVVTCVDGTCYAPKRFADALGTPS
ncbi:DUF7845 domain-containing protein [Halopenitus persicus]|uniref:DUF7845 domain-containing protein n=1 Tax=Halopenitus persicus TaxID=1048396 RepID=UPI000B84A10F|nr:hypothetical protein [Halopenitus persicus]